MFRLALWCWLCSPGLSAGSWLSLNTPHFEMYTNAGRSLGERTLQALELARQVFADANAGGRSTPLRVRVYLFESADDFKPYRLGGARGYYQGGADRDSIAILASGPETRRIAVHEYTHLVLHHTSAPLQRWLEEGLAEFYSTVEVGGDRLRIGGVIKAHLATLERVEWLDAEALVRFDREAPDRTGIFYAQSWALAHMLNLAPEWRGGFASFAALMTDGAAPAEAFARAWGRDLRDALVSLRSYVRNRRPTTVEVAFTPETTPAIRVKLAVDADESDLALGELLLAIGRPAGALRIYQRLASRGPATAGVETALGTLALGRRDFDAARRHLKRAIDLGATDAATFFEHAMLIRDSGGDPSEALSWLHRTIEANPNFAEAHALVGNQAHAEGRTAEAIEHFRRATTVLPRQSTFWHGLALAHHHAGETDQARRAAHRALDSAATAAEREAAQAAVRLADSPATRLATSPKPAVTTPGSWRNRKGDARLEGRLVEVECRNGSARFHLLSGGRRVTLVADRPGEIPINRSTGARREFTCGPQTPASVAVDYIAATGEIVAIEFR